MRLWFIQRIQHADWGEHHAAVIRAETEAEAREIASRELSPSEIWLGPGVACESLDHDGEAGVVISDFNAPG